MCCTFAGRGGRDSCDPPSPLTEMPECKLKWLRFCDQGCAALTCSHVSCLDVNLQVFLLCLLMGSYSSALVPGKLHDCSPACCRCFQGNTNTLLNCYSSGCVRMVLFSSPRSRRVWLDRVCRWEAGWTSVARRSWEVTVWPSDSGKFLLFRSGVASMTSARDGLCASFVLEINLTTDTRCGETQSFNTILKVKIISTIGLQFKRNKKTMIFILISHFISLFKNKTDANNFYSYQTRWRRNSKTSRRRRQIP